MHLDNNYKSRRGPLIAVALFVALLVGGCSSAPTNKAAPVKTGQGAAEQGEGALDSSTPIALTFIAENVLKMFGGQAASFVMTKLGLNPTANKLDEISRQLDELNKKIDGIQASIDRLAVDVHQAEFTDLLQNKLYPIKNKLLAIRDNGLEPVVAAARNLVAAQDAYKADPSEANKKRVDDATAALASARKSFTDIANGNGVHTNLNDLNDLVNPTAGHSVVNVFGRNLMDSYRLLNGRHSEMLYSFYGSIEDLEAMAAWLQAEEILNRNPSDTPTATPTSTASPTGPCGLGPNPSRDDVAKIGKTLCDNATAGRNSLPAKIPNGVVIDRGDKVADTTAGKTMLLSVDGTYTWSPFEAKDGSVPALLKTINVDSSSQGLGYTDWKAASSAALQPLSLEYPVLDKDHPVMLPSGADYLNRTVFALVRTDPDVTLPGQLYESGQVIWFEDTSKQILYLDDDTQRPQQGVETHLAETLGPDAPFVRGAASTRALPQFPAEWTRADSTPVQAYNWQSTVAPIYLTAKARVIVSRVNGGTNYFAQH